MKHPAPARRVDRHSGLGSLPASFARHSSAPEPFSWEPGRAIERTGHGSAQIRARRRVGPPVAPLTWGAPTTSVAPEAGT